MPNLAIRHIESGDQEALLRAILSATDYGVMLTDLDHVTIACNKMFGEIFRVDIESVVHSTAIEVRRMVAPLIPDMDAWAKNLETVYSDPMHSQEDVLTLAHETAMTVRRFTGPVLDHEGAVIGRLWTFLDISAESRQRAIREVLYEISTFFDEDPRAVYQAIVERLAEHYGSNAILSILDGEMLEFRVVASKIPEVKQARGNQLRDSFCQFALANAGPFIVQDALKDGRTCDLLPARFGFTRYAGVPISDPSGKMIGTLCFLDPYSDRPVLEDDVQFLSLLSMRVGAELAREAYLADRIAEKQAVVEAQRGELETTRQVLAAMNRAFELLGSSADLDALLREQAGLLRGLLGYGSVGIFVGHGPKGQLDGWTIDATGATVCRASVSSTLDLSRLFEPGHSLVVPLRNLANQEAYLVFGRGYADLAHDAHHVAHLEALVEQVSLLISSHLLQRELAGAYRELKTTHERLVQSEKLSVVGTLAASTAHDIKNILSSITLELGLGMDDPEKALGAVRSQLDRFSVLAHRLLSYAKPRMVAMQSLQIDEIVQRVLALTAAHTRVTDVTVVTNVQQGLPNVLGDPHQLEHLLVNLVLNAVQAMHEKGGTLTVCVKAGRSGIEVEVGDTGAGLSKEAVDTLFQPFSSTRTEGFGLGLYSCRRIVEEHGGEIRVRTKKDRGTTFVVGLKAVGASS